MNHVFHMRNVVVLLGLVVTAVALVYLATELMDRISEWGRVLSLVLLTILLLALGRHFEADPDATGIVERPGWHWLRVTTAFYVLGLLSALTAVIVFLTIDDLDPIIKTLVALAVGIGLLVGAAKRLGPTTHGRNQ